MYNLYFCKNPELIENYELALADNFKGWHLHHRLETHKRNKKTGKFDILREEAILSSDLKAFKLYYNRPANELIFMLASEHRSMHIKMMPKDVKQKMHSAEHYTPEVRKKISEKLKGNKNFQGHHCSEEHKAKLSAAKKGKKFSDEHRKHLSESHLGHIPWNKGKKKEDK